MKKNKAKQPKTLEASLTQTSKSKLKAKPLKSNLKVIILKNKQKIAESDEQFVNFRKRVLEQGSNKNEHKQDQKSPVNVEPFKSGTEKEYAQHQEKSEEALDELNRMQL